MSCSNNIWQHRLDNIQYFWAFLHTLDPSNICRSTSLFSGSRLFIGSKKLSATNLASFLWSPVMWPVSPKYFGLHRSHHRWSQEGFWKICRYFLWSNWLTWSREETCVPTYVRWSQCVKKGSKILKFVYPMLSCIFGAEHTCHNLFKIMGIYWLNN